MLKPTLFMALPAVLVSSIVGATPWTATPFSPPAIPLAVKSPYVSAWLMQGQGAALNDAWPNFWTGTVSAFTCGSYPTSQSRICRSWAGRDLPTWMVLHTAGWASRQFPPPCSTKPFRRVYRYVHCLLAPSVSDFDKGIRSRPRRLCSS